MEKCNNYERERERERERGGEEVANTGLHCKRMFRRLSSGQQLHPHLCTASHMTTQRSHMTTQREIYKSHDNTEGDIQVN